VYTIGVGLAPSGVAIFPGNVLTEYGFGSSVNQYSMGQKPVLFGAPVFVAIEILAFNALLVFMKRFRDWWPGWANPAGTALLLLAVSQFLPLGLLHYIPYDRYYMPSVLLLVPLAARSASWSWKPALAGGMALVLVAVAGAFYAVGEQDYQAWQVARNNAACLAYQYASPNQVYAGYEAMATYVEVPYYDQHGVILGGVALSTNPTYFSLAGPAAPILSVRFVPTYDPRAGYTYFSLAPAKLVVAHGLNGLGLAIPVPQGAPACPATG